MTDKSKQEMAAIRIQACLTVCIVNNCAIRISITSFAVFISENLQIKTVVWSLFVSRLFCFYHFILQELNTKGCLLQNYNCEGLNCKHFDSKFLHRQLISMCLTI